MNCNEVKELLMPFHDGELDASVRTEVELALADCPDGRAELDELSRIHAFAAVAFEAPEVDLSGVADVVMARIAAEGAGEAAIEGVRVHREAEEPGLLARVSAWFAELFRFERPLAAAGIAAFAIAVFAVASSSPGGGPTAVPGSGPDSIAEAGARTKLPRRGAEGEVAATRDFAAYVDTFEKDAGEVFVLDFSEEEERPLVLWHTVEGEGVPAPERGAKTPNPGAGRGL